MTDEELVIRAQKGDRDAFTKLIDKYSRPLTMMILRMVRDKEDARDISQQVFLKAYEHLPLFKHSSSFKTWLYKVAINSVKDHLRKRTLPSGPGDLEGIADPTDSPASLLEKEQELHLIRAAVLDLPDKQRMTLLLRIYEGMDYGQIAQILGGREQSARGNLYEALKALKHKLTKT
jgi:RNA polymerase sigma-70 factor, ECF subfamily